MAIGLNARRGSDFSAPTLLRDVDGIGISELRGIIGFNRVPPDHNGAVGANHVVSVLNHVMQIYDKQGALLSTQTLDSLFGVVPGANVLPVDPNIMYDAQSDRFIFVAFEVAGGSGGPINTADDVSILNVGVSKTGDPTDGWHVASIDAKTVIGGENTWIDFPGIAVDGEAIYISGNMFQFDAGPDGQRSFAGNRLWIIDKGEGTGGIYDGGAASFTVSDPVGSATDLTGLGVSNGTLMPARIEGALPGTSGIHLLTQGGLSNGAQEILQVISVQNPLTSPTFTAQSISLGDISNENLNFLPNAPQPGGPQPISVVGARILSGAAVWREGKLYASFSVAPKSGPDAGQTTVHWVELDASNPANITLLQQGNIGGEDIARGTYTFDSSINVNKDGSILINYAAAGPSLFAGSYYAIRGADDDAGVFGPSQELRAGRDYYFRNRAGEGISSQTTNRWGDFSSVALDPSDDTTFWFFNQFADLRGDPNGSGQDGRWRVTLGSARPTIQNFQFDANDADEQFYGGIGVDGLQFNGAATATSLTVTPDLDGSVRGDFGGGASGSANGYFVEVVLFDGGDGADSFVVSGDFSGTDLTANGFIAAGGAGSDALSAAALTAAMNVIFDGGADGDTLTGGLGDDTLAGGPGADTINGGAGVDAADYTASGAGVTVSLLSASQTGGDALGDVLTSIENIFGSSFGDQLTGNAGANLITGGAGADVLNGAAGADDIRGEDGNDTVSGGAGDDSVRGLGGNDRVYGDDGNDTLFGHGGNDILEGRNGDDFIKGDAGNDFLIGGDGADSLQGNAGFDTADYRRSPAAVMVDLGAGRQSGGHAEGDFLVSIEKVLGSLFDDQIAGDSGANFLSGMAGNDTMSGGSGADTIESGIGNDNVVGDAGNDRVSGGDGEDTLRGANGNDRVFGEDGNDTLFGNNGNDVLEGRNGNDFMKGDAGADYLLGGDGIDSLIGGAGDDVFVFSNDGVNDFIGDWSGGAGASDRIQLRGYGTAFDTFSEVFGAASQVGSRVVIDFGGGDTLTLLNSQLSDLHQDDFIFI